MPQEGIAAKATDGLFTSILVNLLVEHDAPGTGVWYENKLTKLGSLEITTGGTVSNLSVIHCGSNALERPSPAHDGAQIGDEITEADLLPVSMHCRWIKAKVLDIDGSEATVSATLLQVH